MPRERLLLIEDDPDLQKVLRSQFELDNYTVETAESGEEALAKVKGFQPELIILDLNLPDTDGLKLCKSLRSLTKAPIIILTVRDNLSDKLKGFEMGADDYLTKPFEYLELEARVRACLRRARLISPEKEELDFGHFKVIPAKREVWVRGQRVHLTRKEYDLLELFISHPGEVLSRDFIKQEIWPNKEIYPWSRTLDVHIKRLREKIEPDPENPRYIITHPGVGYRFEP
ncbi:response regulator transcription factor [Thermosulfurimonas sp. F29]|uniref:response regulator transcription factor n=1 Tax=Thermosulfurimonas sp. F29 TaxID=2867247 RepID=UPI001C82E491|nr:response regulator transcription factor [Thermosulfurimonas sp. F29]MBX6422161.1 response regulator transcription factor [Thermosulfurimonas sp. F29]